MLFKAQVHIHRDIVCTLTIEFGHLLLIGNYNFRTEYKTLLFTLNETVLITSLCFVNVSIILGIIIITLSIYKYFVPIQWIAK